MKTACIYALACMVALLLAACASNPSSASKSPPAAAQSTPLDPALSRIRVGHPRDGVPRSWGTYVLIKKEGDAWETAMVGTGRFNRGWFADAKNRRAGEGELLFLADDLSYVSVEFAPLDVKNTRDGTDGRYVCFHVDQGKRNTKDFYPNACNSDLTSNADQLKNTAKQVAVAALTLGITALAANTLKSVDPAKVLAAMDSAGVIPKVKHYRYAQDFGTAKTSAQLQSFINRYRDDDPDGLVSKAQRSLEEVREQERIEGERRAREAELSRQRQERAADLAQRETARRAEAVRLRTARFRQSLQAGDQSHCGLVIEVKKPLVKVQAMIGEYWLRTDQVYAAGDHDCRFVNGQYVEW